MAIVTTVLGPMFVDDKGSINEPVVLLWPNLFTDRRLWDSQASRWRSAQSAEQIQS